jgi:DNA-binding Lrp family transcriptional regulator
VADCFRRLKANGTIRHVRAELNPAAFGRTIEAIVEVKLNPDTSAVAFEAALRHLPQLVSAMLVTGSFDYAMRVACVDRDDRGRSPRRCGATACATSKPGCCCVSCSSTERPSTAGPLARRRRIRSCPGSALESDEAQTLFEGPETRKDLNEGGGFGRTLAGLAAAT